MSKASRRDASSPAPHAADHHDLIQNQGRRGQPDLRGADPEVQKSFLSKDVEAQRTKMIRRLVVEHKPEAIDITGAALHADVAETPAQATPPPRGTAAVLGDMSASHLPLRRGVAVALAALSLGATAAGAAGLDPAIYDTGVPAGQVEHGVYLSTLTGSPLPWNHRVEYWISGNRWREQTTDAKTGELLSGRVHDDTGTTWLQYKPVNSGPKVQHFKGNDSVPGPGYPAAYNRKMVEGSVTEGPGNAPFPIILQPIGPRTIAGFAGTAYEKTVSGQPGLLDPKTGQSIPNSHIVRVLQDGTYQPLMTELSSPNGRYGTIDQRDVLVSRETSSNGAAVARLSRASFARTVRSWKAKVRAAKAKAKKRHKK